jgi:hypothetical protein
MRGRWFRFIQATQLSADRLRDGDRLLVRGEAIEVTDPGELARMRKLPLAVLAGGPPLPDAQSSARLGNPSGGG